MPSALDVVILPNFGRASVSSDSLYGMSLSMNNVSIKAKPMWYLKTTPAVLRRHMVELVDSEITIKL